MKKEEKCISLELAKELQEVAKEAGFELPESEKWWTHSFGGNQFLYRKIEFSNMFFNDYPAYDTSELGEILPMGYGSSCCFENKYNNEWKIIYLNGLAFQENKEKAETEAEARGKMLVYLIKNKLLT